MWIYENQQFNDPQDFFGFVYLIENLTNNRKYIGRKYFTKAGVRQVNGKRKKIRKTSDWENYWGSNETLKREVAELGEHNFRRTILHLCESKSVCSYLETWEIFTRNALLTETYYNDWVTVKVRKDHLKPLVQRNRNTI